MPRVFVRRTGLIMREVSDELMLLDPRDDSMHVLNATGAVLWQRLSEPATVAMLVSAVKDAFDVEVGLDVAGDVQRVLEDLVLRDLVLETTDAK